MGSALLTMPISVLNWRARDGFYHLLESNFEETAHGVLGEVLWRYSRTNSHKGQFRHSQKDIDFCQTDVIRTLSIPLISILSKYLGTHEPPNGRWIWPYYISEGNEGLVIKIWNDSENHRWNYLIESMSDRIQAVMELKGHFTHTSIRLDRVRSRLFLPRLSISHSSLW